MMDTSSSAEDVKRQLRELAASAPVEELLPGTYQKAKFRQRTRRAGTVSIAIAAATSSVLIVTQASRSVSQSRPSTAAAIVSAPSACDRITAQPDRSGGFGDSYQAALQKYQGKIEDIGDVNMAGTDSSDGCLMLFWHGQPNGQVQQLIDAARASGVALAVEQRDWNLADLTSAQHRIFEDAALRARLKINLVRISAHASGIDVGISDPTAPPGVASELQALVGRIPVHVMQLGDSVG